MILAVARIAIRIGNGKLAAPLSSAPLAAALAAIGAELGVDAHLRPADADLL